VVLTVSGRCPSRCAVRASVRWCGYAPITAVSSASISAVDRLGHLADPVVNLGGLECLEYFEQGRLV